MKYEEEYSAAIDRQLSFIEGFYKATKLIASTEKLGKEYQLEEELYFGTNISDLNKTKELIKKYTELYEKLETKEFGKIYEALKEINGWLAFVSTQIDELQQIREGNKSSFVF